MLARIMALRSLGVCAWIWGGMGKVGPIQGARHFFLLLYSFTNVGRCYFQPLYLPVQPKDGSNNSLSLYDNTLLLRHPIKRISTSSGLTATPVAAGLIKGVSKCLIQRLMPPREL